MVKIQYYEFGNGEKAFIGEIAAQVLTMGADDFMGLKTVLNMDWKKQDEAGVAEWFDKNIPFVREAMQLSQEDAEKGLFVAHEAVQKRALKAINK